MKKILKITLIVFSIVFVSAMVAYVFQDKLIFQAVKLDRHYQFSFDQPFEEYFITTSDHQELNALWFKPIQPAKGLVIYFHGNADNLQRWGNYAVDLTQLGYEVIMIDYRGYGKSSGSPHEQDLYNDATLVWNWAKNKSKHKKIMIYGRSLGSAIATHLAAEVEPDLLILETPFDELKSASPLIYLLTSIPLKSTFPTKKYLERVTCKTVIFQGTADWVVHFKSAERLKPFLKKDDEFVVIPKGGHRNLRNFQLYHAKLAEVLE